MSSRLKGGKPSTISDGDRVYVAENSKKLLRTCLQSIHEVTRRYYYTISAEESIPGNLSYLIDIREEDLVEIFKICGFYNSNKKGTFLLTVFQSWVAASFETGTVEVTTFKKINLIKIGRGLQPERPASQFKEGLQAPLFRMPTDTEGQSNRDNLMLLFKKSRPTEATTPTTTARTTATTKPTTYIKTVTTTAAAASR
jgi:hypothetical protein